MYAFIWCKHDARTHEIATREFALTPAIWGWSIAERACILE
jgi:hypothetical protein